MHPTSTVRSSSVNLVKTIVGAGLLAIPYAYRNDGLLVGILLTLLAAITSGFGLFVLGKCSKTLINPRNSSFFTLCMLTYPSLSPLFDLAMIVQCFGVGLSYLVLMGDIFPGLFGGDRNVWIIASALVIAPLCSLKKLDHLKYSSVLGLVALAYLACLVYGMFFDTLLNPVEGNPYPRGEINWLKIYDIKGLFSTFSIIIFAYTGAMNLFSIVNELEDNAMKNITAIITYSISISSLLFISVGTAGYLTFGSNTLGNIMLNYDPESIWVNIGKFSLASMLLLSFPLLFHPLRIAVNNLVVWFEMNYSKKSANGSNSLPEENETPIILQVEDEEEGGEEEIIESPATLGEIIGVAEETPLPGDEELATPFPDSRFYIITGLLLLSLYTLALRVSSFALVLALVGATGSTSISFTLPGLFGYRLIGSDSLAIGRMIPRSDRIYKVCSLLLVYFGISVMVLSLYVTLAYGA